MNRGGMTLNKRYLAALLAAAMIFSMAPTSAYAASLRLGGTKTETTQEAAQEKKSTTKKASSTQKESEWQQEMLDSINAARKKAGLQPLKLNEDACKAAQVRAKECLKKYDHTRPNGKSLTTALDEAGVKYSYWGENINEKQATVSSTMKSWMASKGHKANILGENFDSVGFGRAKDKNGSYTWVQMFYKAK